MERLEQSKEFKIFVIRKNEIITELKEKLASGTENEEDTTKIIARLRSMQAARSKSINKILKLEERNRLKKGICHHYKYLDKLIGLQNDAGIENFKFSNEVSQLLKDGVEACASAIFWIDRNIAKLKINVKNASDYSPS